MVLKVLFRSNQSVDWVSDAKSLQHKLMPRLLCDSEQVDGYYHIQQWWTLLKFIVICYTSREQRLREQSQWIQHWLPRIPTDCQSRTTISNCWELFLFLLLFEFLLTLKLSYLDFTSMRKYARYGYNSTMLFVKLKHFYDEKKSLGYHLCDWTGRRGPR